MLTQEEKMELSKLIEHCIMFDKQADKFDKKLEEAYETGDEKKMKSALNDHCRAVSEACSARFRLCDFVIEHKNFLIE